MRWTCSNLYNPGDGLIRRFELLGSAPEDRNHPLPDGLKIEVADDFGITGTPAFLIAARNMGEERSTSIAHGSAQLSSAKTTTTISALPRWKIRGPADQDRPLDRNVIRQNGFKSASYTVDPACAMPEHFELAPGQTMSCRVTFKVSPGQYQFMVGYGGGVFESESLVSNAISFDLDRNGVATLQP